MTCCYPRAQRRVKRGGRANPRTGRRRNHAVSPSMISNPVSMISGVPGRSDCRSIVSTAIRPMRNRFDRMVESGNGRA